MNYPDKKQLAEFESSSDSPFHRAEQLIQAHLGVRDKMEQFGRRVIRDHFPEQHRQFYREQSYIFAGHLDEQGWPWASIIPGRPGFIQSPDATHLDIDISLMAEDRLRQSLQALSIETERDDRPLAMGFLGADLATRRRNRFSALVEFQSPDSEKEPSSLDTLHVSVQQSFGNCPQYIQKRYLNWLDDFRPEDSKSHEISVFDEHIQSWIENADTFFVSSANLVSRANHVRDGVDISHRGGQPGFVKVEDKVTLTIPDYAGNFHFNTFGNFIEYPRAGLLFVDFESRRLLQLTGTVEILWNDPRIEHFDGAERLWQFQLKEGVVVEHALPFGFSLEEFSPNSLLTSTWTQAEKVEQAARLANQWQSYRVASVHDESETIRSFHLENDAGMGQPVFMPGQFLTVRVPEQTGSADQGTLSSALSRTYSVSSSPWDDGYRISVKKEAKGLVSRFMHEQLTVGDYLEIKAPMGGFHLDLEGQRPVILLAGGVGITPMVSMVRASCHYRIKTRGGRNLTLFAAAGTKQERAFHDELSRMSQALGDTFNYYSVLSRPEPDTKPGRDYNYKGYIDQTLLQSVLPLDDYEVYLCGPAAFMQSMYDLVSALGIPDHRIFAESFGPSALRRNKLKALPAETRRQAEAADVQFQVSGVEQLWTPEQGSLLEFAEGHGLEPAFSCRSGSCGACKTKLISGSVVQTVPSDLPLDKDELLLCCSVPAASEEEGENPLLVLEL